MRILRPVTKLVPVQSLGQVGLERRGLVVGLGRCGFCDRYRGWCGLRLWGCFVWVDSWVGLGVEVVVLATGEGR